MTDKTIDESILYPNSSSEGGFLAEGEPLQGVIDKDATTLKDLGVTHKQIADRLEYVIGRALRIIHMRVFENDDLDYFKEVHNGIDVDGIHVTWTSWMGYQGCPWGCASRKNKGRDNFALSDTDFRMSKDGVVITPSKLLVHLIRSHWFFEGHTKYRLDPADAVKVLGVCPGVDYTPVYDSEWLWSVSSAVYDSETDVNEIIKEYCFRDKEIYDNGTPITLEGHPDVVVRLLGDRMLIVFGGRKNIRGAFVIGGLRLNRINPGISVYHKYENHYVRE